MQTLITGGAGFVGQLLAKKLLEDGHKVTLVDIIEPPIPKGATNVAHAKCLKVDLVSSAEDAVDQDLDVAFVFHGVMSAGSEGNFELGQSANIDATRNLFNSLRKKRPGVRVIYASSYAVYGQPLPDMLTDATKATPESSYGAAKLICDLLVNDYTRKGFLDGLSLRFPTISVRPGTPTAAASSFLSGMIREPFNGEESRIPIENLDYETWICSPKTLLINLLYAMTMETSKLSRHIRQVNLPGITVSVREMMGALEKVGGQEKLKLLKVKTDPALVPILESWPARVDISSALKLGFHPDPGFEQAVVDYKDSLEA